MTDEIMEFEETLDKYETEIDALTTIFGLLNQLSRRGVVFTTTKLQPMKVIEILEAIIKSMDISQESRDFLLDNSWHFASAINIAYRQYEK